MFNRVKTRRDIVNSKRGRDHVTIPVEIPSGMYDKCPQCETIHDVSKLGENKWVCENCDHHYRLHIAQRAQLMFDRFRVFNHRIKSKDPLNFAGYKDKLKALSETQGVYDAVVCGEATLNDHEVIAIIMDPLFMMGSMGSVVGEKITRAFERAQFQKKPVILFSASGGARMQEGIISLMQMAKTSAVVGQFGAAGGLFINVLTDPTTGGVTASFAMLGDIILAEPNALIGFAGPRVIEQTIGSKLPEGFQRSEFLVEKGFVDRVVHRHDLKETLATILAIHGSTTW